MAVNMDILGPMSWMIAILMSLNALAAPNAITSLNLKASKVIKTPLFSVTVPKGWSYQRITGIHDTTHLAKNQRSRSFFTQDLLMTPNDGLLTSDIYLGIRDDLPGTFNPGKHGPTQQEKWAGYTWEFVEWTSGPEGYQTVHWIGATRLNPNQQLVILAGGPKSVFENYREKFFKVLKTMTK